MGRPKNCNRCNKPKKPKNPSENVDYCNCGRPTKMTNETVNKLEQAFAIGCTDEEACSYAGISRETLNKYQNKNKEFLDKKHELKLKPVLKARQTIVNGLGNISVAQWYAGKKMRKEFGNNIDITTGGKPIKDKSIAEEVKGWFDTQSKDADKDADTDTNN
ncbi:MAG: hypothetical protein WDZ80_00615 [Candidatus Paceibacterota bacterium]